MPKNPLPKFVPPMMAESAKAPFDSPDWIFEIKLDGYRAITVFNSSGKPHLWSRNGLALEAKFPAIARAVFKPKLREPEVFLSSGSDYWSAGVPALNRPTLYRSTRSQKSVQDRI
jgi:ATP-dependent DNA ligase